ncbi:unnamed protein product [Mycena citricolor]|uniref:Ubiquitin-like protease family profile domain-containing protein n=1 Tax=Mycena citricolor TaxID=2018698 RepID=A0AAD2HQ98_9AGAR|nr:unnamed protein product [Mycena citricolor]
MTSGRVKHRSTSSTTSRKAKSPGDSWRMATKRQFGFLGPELPFPQKWDLETWRKGKRRRSNTPSSESEPMDVDFGPPFHPSNSTPTPTPTPAFAATSAEFNFISKSSRKPERSLRSTQPLNSPSDLALMRSNAFCQLLYLCAYLCDGPMTKRRGEAILRPAKHPRLAMLASDGEKASPGGSSASSERLRKRWVAHFRAGVTSSWSWVQETAELVRETILTAYATGPDDPEPSETADHVELPTSPALPTPPSSPTFARDDSRERTDLPNVSPALSQISSLELVHHTEPRTPRKKNSHQTQTSKQISSTVIHSTPRAPGSSRVPWPSTSNSQTPNSEIESEANRHEDTVRRRHKHATRNHIFHKKHKMHVQANIAGQRENLLRELYAINQKDGYSSDFKTFKGFVKKQAMLQNLMRSRSASLNDVTRISKDEETQFLRRALEKAQATLNGPKPLKPQTPYITELQFRFRSKDTEVDQRLRRSPLPSTLPPADDAGVTQILKRSGVVSKYAREQVTRDDIARLLPSTWLNDEVINFYGALILGRSEGRKENAPAKPAPYSDILNVHYFSTFFWSKLEKDGYEKSRLAKWTKKIDIFSKDSILIPVNHANVHWTAAAINFRQKRIESFDSMREERKRVHKLLRIYLDQEHRNKKNAPFDFTGWVDYSLPDVPRQENGFDCGVFTCQFLESLSRGEQSFNFAQKDIPYLRRRMIWEIGNATLREEH